MNTALSVDGIEVAGPFPGLYLLQALDRPARLEVELPPPPWREVDRLAPGNSPLRVGSRVVLRSGDEVVFHGAVERWGQRLGAAAGSTRWLVAYDDYHRLRDVRTLGPWYQTTDSEVAERIASALELVARVEKTTSVHAVVEPRGDLLRFLRQRARDCGHELAVWEGRLYFARSITALASAISLRQEQVLRFALEERRFQQTTLRGGCLELLGDWRWKPLLAFDLEGLDGAAGGRYRSIRAMHVLNRTGFRTQVDLVAAGMDYSKWLQQDSESEIVDLHQ